MQKDCLESFESKIKVISTNCEKLANKISQDYISTRVEYDHINLCYCNLLSIRQEIKVIHLDIQCHIEKIEGIIFDKIQKWEDSIESDPTFHNVDLNLKNIKRIANNIISFRVRVNERIDDILKIYKSRHDAKPFAKLGTVLNQDRYGLGQSIVSEHKFFIIFIQ